MCYEFRRQTQDSTWQSISMQGNTLMGVGTTLVQCSFLAANFRMPRRKFKKASSSSCGRKYALSSPNCQTLQQLSESFNGSPACTFGWCGSTQAAESGLVMASEAMLNLSLQRTCASCAGWSAEFKLQGLPRPAQANNFPRPARGPYLFASIPSAARDIWPSTESKQQGVDWLNYKRSLWRVDLSH